MPKVKTVSERRYIISDRQGRELGESSGETKATALVHLFRMDPQAEQITARAAEKMIQGRRVSFQQVA